MTGDARPVRPAWRDVWDATVGIPPVDGTSREVSVQEVLAELIAGRRCAWFVVNEPTREGAAFLTSLWRAAFGTAPAGIDWFTSEYELRVPEEWRAEIPFTYRCPDFACGTGEWVLVLELKTERRSYSPQQMRDYLRLARHRLPTAMTDVWLLGPHRPNASPPHDDKQRYGELTWHDVVRPLRESFAEHAVAEGLARFLEAGLAAAAQGEGGALAPKSPAPILPVSDVAAAAAAHATRMAPSVAGARGGDKVERGIDVELWSPQVAREARSAVTDALEAGGWSDRVSVWQWTPASTGAPSTPAGDAAGRELRLAPTIAQRPVV